MSETPTQREYIERSFYLLGVCLGAALAFAIEDNTLGIAISIAAALPVLALNAGIHILLAVRRNELTGKGW